MKHVFIIERRNRNPLVLSPFHARKEMNPSAMDEGMEIVVSRIFPSSFMDECLRTAYRDVDGYVSAWVADKRYIPRMLISAVVFLVAYFVMSIALRDPLPIIDELLIGIAATALTWRYLARRDSGSLQLTQTRLRLKQALSSADVVESSFIAAVTDYLDEAASLDTLTLSDRIFGHDGFGSLKEPDASLPGLAQEFREVLESWILLNDKNMARRLSEVRTATTEKKMIRVSSALVHDALHQQLDLPLLSLMCALDSMARTRE
ncbi:hypothetical protein [Parasphaerochaeta coccoides]|uniref:Uncharacterized protein n=1 Tax=Parasphaerochaeta coccoides (strain ATCC BAA-1237 / DSM 17374 / SPN1) TaxID=760011 RepID=F4GJH3_PARC1|nr:hypothetical protein [Parasphaerochaeta coccoides]AEC02238.1 hypothetical protein Spico_1016 [Parasphaerochaeta coccoides DSM 17374]